MAYVSANFHYPPVCYEVAAELNALAPVTIDATGEKLAFWGRVNKTGNIRNVGIQLGTITKAGGSGWTLSLQDIDLANGPITRPDGTQDQTYAIANGNAGFVSNAFFLSGNLSADRAVTRGDLLGVVLEFDGGGRLGSDAAQVYAGCGTIRALQGISLYASSAWAYAGVGGVNCLLKYDDGSCSTFQGGLVASSVAFIFYKSDSTPDESALEFQAPWAGKIDGGWALTSFDASAAHDYVLYDGTTALATVSIDPNTQLSPSDGRVTYFAFSSEVTVSKDATYRIAMKPTQSSSYVSLNYIDVNAAEHFDALAGESGKELFLNSRTDAGSWGAGTTTRRPMMGVHYSAIDIGAAGSGGLLAHPGMRGGFA